MLFKPKALLSVGSSVDVLSSPSILSDSPVFCVFNHSKQRPIALNGSMISCRLPSSPGLYRWIIEFLLEEFIVADVAAAIPPELQSASLTIPKSGAIVTVFGNHFHPSMSVYLVQQALSWTYLSVGRFSVGLPPSLEGKFSLLCTIDDVVFSNPVSVEYGSLPVISHIQPTLVLGGSRSIVTVTGVHLQFSGQAHCFIGNHSIPYMMLSSQQGSCVLNQKLQPGLLNISVGIDELFKSDQSAIMVLDSYVLSIFPSVAFDSGAGLVTLSGFNFYTLSPECNFGGMKFMDASIISDNVAHCNIPVSDAGMTDICFGIHVARCFPFFSLSAHLLF